MVGRSGEVVTTPKRPGWGLVQAIETRAGPQGQPQALICHPDHEACFWVGLQELARHRARVIYQPTANPFDADPDPDPASRPGAGAAAMAPEASP